MISQESIIGKGGKFMGLNLNYTADVLVSTEDMQEEKLLEVRHALSHRRFDLEFGETAGIKHCTV